MGLRVAAFALWTVGCSMAWCQETVIQSPIFEVEEPQRSAAIAQWEDDIAKLESLDSSESHGSDEILLVGSSSIRRWDNVAVDMAPYRVIRRGYGGAKYSDLAVFCERLIQPHDYRAVIFFVGNDVSGRPDDHTPDQVERWVRHIVDVAQRHRPDSPVLLIEVTPTIQRFEHWSKIRQLNARLREIALSTPMVFFVSTAEQILDPSGQPRGDLFVDDMLHLNEQGYAVWSKEIRDRLDEVFRLIARYPGESVNEPQD